MSKKFISTLMIMVSLLYFLPASSMAAASDYLIDNGVLIKYSGTATEQKGDQYERVPINVCSSIWFLHGI